MRRSPNYDDASIDSLIGPPDANGCRYWRSDSAPESGGRPRIQVNGNPVPAARYVLARKLGRPLRKKELACHSCDVPPCCNPDHLFPGTAKDNSVDMLMKGRHGGMQGNILTPEAIDSIRYSREAPRLLAITHKISDATVRKIKCVATWDRIPLRRSSNPPYDVLLPHGFESSCYVDLKKTLAWKLAPMPPLEIIMPTREPGSRITQTDVTPIRYDPRPVKEIAASYGVSEAAIRKMKSLETWSLVPLLRTGADMPMKPVGYDGPIPRHLR